MAARSETFTFEMTTYYTPEMGTDLQRCYIVFKNWICPGKLAHVKLTTNSIEHEFLDEGCRTVNLDPGLLTAHSLILASGKDFSHRIYLRDGIYAEVTLMVKDGRLDALPWTYKDYRLPEVVDFFEEQRRAFLRERREQKRRSG